ncbi:MAG: MATE family efflux transporter [Lentimicrobiaceae bacterium]|nr:MATE family efflux transporter [Lentimicrobiaceae bacterium]
MKENTNKAIVYNSFILYARLVINTVCSLLTTRFAFKALGVVDYGLFSILGGVISFIAIINTIMAGTTRRFIAIAIGKNDIYEANEQFNVNLIIQVLSALLVLIIALPIGRWYVFNCINYEGSLSTAYYVFFITVLGSVLSFAGVAFNGLLTAKENFFIFSLVDVISHILKLIVALLLVNHFENKLIIYAITMSVLTGGSAVIYAVYCRIKYFEITKFKFVRKWDKYKDVLNFAKWNSYGVIAYVAKEQGAGIIVNMFFNTLMNAALGIANTINGFISMFSHNATNPISPQLTKSYSANDINRATYLLIVSNKVAYLLMFVVSIPFLIETEFILKLWLGNIPPYAVLFIRLMIIERLIDSLNNGIAEIVFANGNISFYQITTNTTRLLSVIVGYFVLKAGYPAYYLMICYIICSIFIVLFKHISLGKIKDIDNRLVFKRSFVPSLIITILSVPIFIFNFNFHSLVNIVLKEIYVLTIILVIGLSKAERKYIIDFVKKKIKL